MYIGSVPPSSDKDESFQIFKGRTYQRYKLVTELTNGKIMGMWYQIPDSTKALGLPHIDRVRQKIPLDSYEVNCP